MNFLKFLILALSLIFILSSCASLTGYQDGRSIGEGNGEIVASLNVSQSPNFTDLKDSSSITKIPSFGFPNIELGGRYGVIEKLDITLRLNTNLNLGAGFKYQIIGDRLSNFALGVGAEMGTFGLISGLWNAQLPLHLSFHPTESLAIYLSPRYIHQFTTLAGIGGWNYAGGNVGLLIGKRHKFGIDAGFYQVSADGSKVLGLTSFGVGGKFMIGNSNPPNSNESISPSGKKKRK